MDKEPISAGTVTVSADHFKRLHKVMSTTLSSTSSTKTVVSGMVDPSIVEEWTRVQEELSTRIVTVDTEEWQRDIDTKLKLVGGLDISYPKDAHDKAESTAYAALVVVKFPSMEVVYQAVDRFQIDVPYVAGFLAFRELSPLLTMIRDLVKSHPEFTPDVLLVDGNGLLHPQKCGIACHVGSQSSIPTIGVAKNLFVMMDACGDTGHGKKDFQKMEKVGDFEHIKDNDGRTLGVALKSTAEGTNPIYVSVGHKISLETAVQVVLRCCKHRVPEPVRFADMQSRDYIRKGEATDLGKPE